MAILEVEHLSKSFDRTEVLKDITFSLEKGQVLSIIGSSGSGKTTLLRCLNFLERPDGGSISVNGETLFDILAEISNENAAGEYYLTDAVAVALRKGLKCSAVECPVEEASAANTQEELALLEVLYKKRKGK